MNESREHLRQLLLDILRQRVEMRAFELYQARGCADGSDVEDWLRAEIEVVGQSISAPLFKRAAA